MARARYRTRWIALAIAASLVAGWAAFSDPVSRWAGFTDMPAGQGPSSPLRAAYPVAMELPDLAFAGDAQVGKSPSAQEAQRGDTPELAAKHPEAPVQTMPRAIPPGPASAPLLPARFNVADFGTSALDDGGQIRTTKPVFVAGNRVGTIELAVGRGASVSLDPGALAALVADRAPPLTAALARTDGNRVTLSALRTRAVSIRYDPVADALLIETQP